ncbi:unnamed protein product [Dimorphilus gyrociliatus]|uniref:Glutaredoxin domain-containing protein n=1 Tax=Dimorphilus gyrociliatus TaxID=2664684 RepID=A0A7I8VUH4_9ANNE|nr:unnamed protein product [Dimorphilus gyrociliatus]
MAASRKFVDQKIKQRKVLMFAKAWCSECKQAIKILNEYKMPPDTFEVLNIDSRQDCSKIEDYFQVLCLTDRRNVPRLFIDGNHIGDLEVIRRMHEDNRLRETLIESEAIKS